MIAYEDLEKHFTVRKVISPFYGEGRIPRKEKKRVKKFADDYWDVDWLTKPQIRWWYLGKTNPDYKRFLIKQICKP